MKFYKVLVSDKRDRKSGFVTVGNELITEKERAKHFSTVADNVFTAVEVSKRNTYWFFGARFEKGVTV